MGNKYRNNGYKDFSSNSSGFGGRYREEEDYADSEKNHRKDRWEKRKGRKKGHGGSDDYDPRDW